MGWVSISPDYSIGAVEKQLGKEYALKLWNRCWPHEKYDPKACIYGFSILREAISDGFKPDGFSVGTDSLADNYGSIRSEKMFNHFA